MTKTILTLLATLALATACSRTHPAADAGLPPPTASPDPSALDGGTLGGPPTEPERR